MKRHIFAFASAALVAGCWGHSYPDTNVFIKPVAESFSPAETVQVFVDPNGTFYPTGWTEEMKRYRSWKADSLLNESNEDPVFRSLIENGEREQLTQLAEFGRDKERILILIHGYNNEMNVAQAAFVDIERKVELTPQDGIVRFYWDGLTGSGIGGGKIWFNAAGYSQLAGQRGLRRVLESFSDKEIFLISHSRGASVVLSALGNPVYDPEFLKDTMDVSKDWGPTYRNFLQIDPYKDRGNRIHVIALAPAVDRIDFCNISEQPLDDNRFDCARLRPLRMVESFRYTINPSDRVLNKFVGLSGGFNPTGLGVQPSIGVRLAEDYGFLTAYPFSDPQTFHGFPNYVQHETFDRMLTDAGLMGSR